MSIPHAKGTRNNEGRLFLKLNLYLNDHSFTLEICEFLAFVASTIHK